MKNVVYVCAHSMKIQIIKLILNYKFIILIIMLKLKKKFYWATIQIKPNNNKLRQQLW